jgi:catechol 2,3-dioxygenase-like lactoylglutathione lyase family enzyme
MIFRSILNVAREHNLQEVLVELGAFSISLAVKDIAASKAFYETIGFAEIGGEETQNWLIMKNGAHVVGLFQGMFEKNSLTFNPGWDQEGNTLESFMDVREMQKKFKSAGLELISEADESTEGPASCVLIDPDGNPILIDQHV